MKPFIRDFKEEFISISILLWVILAGQAYCQHYKIIDPDIHPLINQLSPDIKGKTLSGKTFDLKDYRGKILVINVWGLKCITCYREIVELNALSEEYRNKNVTVISLMADSRIDVLEKVKTSGEFYKLYKSHVGNENIDFEIIPDAQPIIAKFDIEGVPMNFVIDQKGIVRGFSNGYRQVSSIMYESNFVPQQSENYKVLTKKIEDVIVGDNANR